MKILETIREILKFKDYATISEISKLSGIPQAQVLKIINDNGAYVWRNRKNGRITKVDTKSKLVENLWNSGDYYKIVSYGAWSHEGYKIEVLKDQEEKISHLTVERVVGAIGDSWYKTLVEATDENIKEVESLGFTNWDKRVIDDRLWAE